MDSCDENGNGVLGVCVPIPLVVVVVVVVVVLCSIAFVCLTVGAVLVFHNFYSHDILLLEKDLFFLF